MKKSRLITSAHDFIFSVGCIALLLCGAWFTGHLGCVFSWNSSKQINAINMAYSGDIDEKGNYKARGQR